MANPFRVMAHVRRNGAQTGRPSEGEAGSYAQSSSLSPPLPLSVRAAGSQSTAMLTKPKHHLTQSC